MRRIPGLLVIVLCTVCVPARFGQAAPESNPELPEARAFARDNHAALSALVVDLRTGTRLVELHSRLRLIPASLSKLYVVATALRTWGPKKRFTTRLLAKGPIHDGVLHGDLVMLGGGDPALTALHLHQLAWRAHKAGLRRVTGNLVVNESRFGLTACGLQDRCKAENISRNAYAAPLSAAAVDFNTWCVAIRPGPRKGGSATVQYCQPVRDAPPIQGRVSTASADSKPDLHVARVSKETGAVLRVNGSVPLGGRVQRFYRGVGSPSLHTALLMRQALRDRGIRIDGQNRAHYGPPAGSTLVARFRGQTLRQLLPRMLAFSNNFMADMLTLDLAAHRGQKPPLKLGQAARVLFTPQSKPQPSSSGADPAPPALRSGSGLSVGSRVSANGVVALLSDMYHRPSLFPAFLGAMTVPAYSPFAFLNQSTGLWSTHTTVKTGIIHNPVTAVTLAGYIRLPDNDWGAFAVLLNGTEKQPDLDIQDAVDSVYADINELLSPQSRLAGRAASR